AYDGWSDDGQNSRDKSPTFYGKTEELGPLANMLCKQAAGRESTQTKLKQIIALNQNQTCKTLQMYQHHSTLDRIILRTFHSCEL
ncbi:nickel-dependent hydrogenase large subunit, partial [Salmonella enterica subsp. enterica serovar Infantis]